MKYYKILVVIVGIFLYGQLVAQPVFVSYHLNSINPRTDERWFENNQYAIDKVIQRTQENEAAHGDSGK
jgi:hypothetical protein